MKKSILVAFLTAAVTTSLWVLASGPLRETVPASTGPYLGQKVPGAAPALFAPGVVSTGMFTRDIAMTPDGKEIYWTVAIGNYSIMAVVFSRLSDGRWTAPEVAPFSADARYRTLEPAISPDGKRFFFVSNRPAPGKVHDDKDFDIWVMERTGEAWGEPRNLGDPVNTDAGEYFPSVTNDGSLYFTRENPDGSDFLFYSRLAEGRYGPPERLPKQINGAPAQFNAFVAPDESYLIFSAQGRKENLGGADYYVAFRQADGAWSVAANLGPTFNGRKVGGYSPFVSRDGKYFFFMSTRQAENLFQPGEKLAYAKLLRLHDQPGSGIAGIYWIDASFLQALRPGQGEAKAGE